MKSDFLGSRSRESDFEICWSRSWILIFDGVGVGSRILKFARVGVEHFPFDSAALVID